MWLRRDLRLENNTALNAALASGLRVLPIFIFDDHILNKLPHDDARINFIYQQLDIINQKLVTLDSVLLVRRGDPETIIKDLVSSLNVTQLYFNRDYEPYARKRDGHISKELTRLKVGVFHYKDQIVFEPGEILKPDAKPYTIFTPFKNKWLKQYSLLSQTERNPASRFNIKNPHLSLVSSNNLKVDFQFPSLQTIGFESSDISVKPFSLKDISRYAETRDYPAQDATSFLSPHLRFGTVSVHKLVLQLGSAHPVFLSELIWREFFMHILYHFPMVVQQNFNSKYNGVQWLNNPSDFKKWCNGQTGYPMVDAGMRQLNQTGFMHNRVRMITAGFLCKHLLIDWRKGEKYFAQKLLDYDLSANNGNWQWAAGTGCDAAPYFRIFNPMEQLKKFDKNLEYIKKWIPEYGTPTYPVPIVEHSFARNRCLEVYKSGIASAD
jgi:deoxyribodipyrimidine photo-lyase